MAVNEHKSLPQEVIELDRESLLALKNLRDYAPPTPALGIEAVSALEAQLRQAEEAEVMAKKALKTARDARIAAGWRLHNTILSVKASVAGQYGPSSDALQSLGLKKKTEYRRPSRRNGAES